ncbi:MULTISPECIES: hypothetical protein [unclassified Nitrobacter]|uniref:hypothetical protein n=1 Tax=unclassified Nitrobacter TaxID=2620411 RepID=UPI001ACA452B|nr:MULTISPECIES: hypothetical protein [unclassified Nitrobacter]MBN9147181.1 hypothetical protein [Nitrobacter sp.]
MSKAIAGLTARLSDFTGVVNSADAQFKAGARAEQLRGGVANVVSKAFAATQIDGRKEGQQIATARATALSVDPATPATAYIRQNFLAHWNAANIGQKGDLVAIATVEELSAVIETKSYQGLPVEFQKTILDDFILKRHINRTGLQSEFSLQPDHEFPLRTGPNVEAAMAASRDALNRLNARSDTIANVNNTLLGLIDLVALATDQHRNQAYDLLVNSNIAA